MLDSHSDIVQQINSDSFRSKHTVFRINTLPYNALIKLAVRSFKHEDWSLGDRVKLRLLSKAYNAELGKHIRKVFLRRAEDIVKIRNEFPNLRVVTICIPNMEGVDGDWYGELGMVKGLELQLESSQAVESFALALKSESVAQKFQGCEVSFQYCGQHNQQQVELDNITTISDRLRNSKIIVEHVVKELIGTRGPKPLLQTLKWLDNVYLRLKLEFSDIDWPTMQYIQEYIYTNKTKVLEVGFVGGDVQIEDRQLLQFLDDNHTLQRFSFGHPKISRGKKVCYLSKGHVTALSVVPELQWTLFSAKEWEMLRDLPNLVKISMAETASLPKLSFWQAMPRLRTLDLTLQSSRGDSLRVLSELKLLRTLIIREHGKSVPPPWLEGLAVLTQITKLEIFAPTVSIGDTHLQTLTFLTSLRELSLEYRKFNITNFSFVIGLANLEILKLRSVELLRNEVIYFHQLKKLLNLREIHMFLFKDNTKHVQEMKRLLACERCNIFV